MTLEFRNVVDAGNLKKERLVMRAASDIDVGDYAILLTSLDGDNDLDTRVRHAFWFPYEDIIAGSLIVLYTKPGIASTKDGVVGKKTHFYYWNLDAPIWNDPKATAVLLNSPTFTTFQNTEVDITEE